MPGPPVVEWIWEGLEGGGPSILIVRSTTSSGCPVYGLVKLGG